MRFYLIASCSRPDRRVPRWVRRSARNELRLPACDDLRAPASHTPSPSGLSSAPRGSRILQDGNSRLPLVRSPVAPPPHPPHRQPRNAIRTTPGRLLASAKAKTPTPPSPTCGGVGWWQFMVTSWHATESHYARLGPIGPSPDIESPG